MQYNVRNQKTSSDIRRRYQSVKQTVRIGNFSYCPTDNVGQGMSSLVYRGLNHQTRQTVAIKVIEKEAMKNKSVDMLFRNEVKILSQLKHQNILELVSTQQNDKHFWVITEYCDAGDVEKMIKKNKKLTQAKSLEIFRDVVEGYKTLVQAQIIHRDIKPANVFICNNKAKIADFGFAMNIGDIQAGKMNVGSPLYMPPQCLAYGEYSHKSDIFGLGVLLFEMLHGRTPWTARSEKQLLIRMKGTCLTIDQTLSDKTKSLLRKCLHSDPARRMHQQQLFDFMDTYDRSSTRSSSTKMQESTKQSIEDGSAKQIKDDKESIKHFSRKDLKIESKQYFLKQNQVINILRSPNKKRISSVINNKDNPRRTYLKPTQNEQKQTKYTMANILVPIKNNFVSKPKPPTSRQIIGQIIKIKSQTLPMQMQDPLKRKVLQLLIRMKLNLKKQSLHFLPHHLISKLNFLVECYERLLLNETYHIQIPTELKEDKTINQLINCKNLSSYASNGIPFLKRMVRLIAHYLKQSKSDFLMLSDIVTFYRHFKDLCQDENYWNRKELAKENIEDREQVKEMIGRLLV